MAPIRKCVLVTGGADFISSEMVTQLVAQGIKVQDIAPLSIAVSSLGQTIDWVEPVGETDLRFVRMEE